MSKQDGSSRQVTTGPVDDSATPILHVDMDAFFVSVELLKRPELRGKPVLVGGTAGRGVVAAASYEARRFGVNSAMPMSVALQRCPNAVVLRGDYAQLLEYSKQRHDDLRRDHAARRAALDRRGVPRRVGRASPARQPRRDRVDRSASACFDETGLTCSIGVAATKYVAKVASSRAKPDGMLVVPAGRHDRVPAPAARLRALGRRAGHRRVARPARPAHRRRRGRDAARRARTRGRAGTRGRSSARLANGIDPRRRAHHARREEHRARVDVQPRPHRPRRHRAANCCGSRTTSPCGCARRAWSAAPWC